jgi:hypothetical protein
MKWYAQVVHVARKDLRLAGWLMFAYAAVVAGATAGALEWGISTSAVAPLPTFGLVLLGMLLVAVLVQADSPARSDDFWASRPLYPLAVFSAKILVALLLLLGLPLQGQLVGLFAHDVAARDLPALLADSVLSYGSWLGMAAVIAALTRDLRTFLVALVLVTLGWFIGLQALGFLLNPSMTPGPPPPLLVPLAMVTGMLLVLAHQYVTRDVRRGLWIAGALAVGSIVLPLVVPRAAWSVVSASGIVPDHLRLVGLSIQDVRVQSGSEVNLQLHFEGVSPFHQYALVSPIVHLHTPDGSVMSHALNTSRVGLGRSSLRLPEEFQWLGEQPSPGAFTLGFSTNLSEAQIGALFRGGARLVLQGHIEVREPRVMADLPLESGATDAQDGRRVRIVGVERTVTGPSVEVRISAVSPAKSSDFEQAYSAPFWESPFVYALVNREQKEALALDRGESSGSSFSLVLPGPRAWTEKTQLRRNPQYPDTSLAQISEEWLRQARLLLVRWVPMGSYPVMIESQSPVVRAFVGSPGPRVRVVRQREHAAGQ